MLPRFPEIRSHFASPNHDLVCRRVGIQLQTKGATACRSPGNHLAQVHLQPFWNESLSLHLYDRSVDGTGGRHSETE
jgi:hypothetical protein